MYRFYIEPSQKQGDIIEIMGEDVNHIRNVLRMKNGEKFMLCDGAGTDYLCELSGSKERNLVATVLEEKKSDTELPVRLVLFQGLPKKDKMELIIQKAVELGVYEIVPVATKRCVVKLDAKKEASKIARWQAIAEAAAKQSKRDVIPQIGAVMTLKEALREANEFEVSIMPYENAEGMAATRSLLDSIRPGQRVAIFIGPEGGFDDTEVEAALALGTRPVTLGRRILRTETAGLAMLSMLVYVLEM